MANFQASFTVRDGDNVDSSVVVYGVFADSAAAKTALQTLVELVDDVILGKVIAVRLTEVLDIGGYSLKASATTGADREIKGRFIFGTSVANVRPKLSLPTFDKDTWTIAGGDIPFDLSAGAPTAIDSLGVALVDQNWTDYRFQDFNDLLEAYEVFE